MGEDNQVLIAADSRTIVGLVESAVARLVVLAPAVPIEVAKAIRERWLALGPDKVSVTLDVDPEVYRLGYGDPESLPLLEATGREVGSLLQCHPGVRIGVVVADGAVLVYSPIPALIEAGPRAPTQPTGLLISGSVDAVEGALGVGPGGVLDQEVGLDKATLSDIDEVAKDLAANPPQKFDVARTVRVFNAAFQFVELSITGTQMHRRKVQIPSYLLGVAERNVQDELTAALQVVPDGHELSGETIKRKRRRIEKRYLKVIAGFGHAVLRKDKDAFERDVQDLKAEVEKFRELVGEKLEQELEKRVNSLADALMPRLKVSPPEEWIVPHDSERREEAIRRSLEEDLWQALGRVDDYTSDIAVKLVFRDVTYESLMDSAFREAAARAFPKLERHLHAEFDAAAAVEDSPQPE